MPQPADQSCATCQFFIVRPGYANYCCRRAPSGGSMGAPWCHVLPDWWCGEWQVAAPAKEPAP